MLVTHWLRFVWSRHQALRKYLAEQPYPPYRRLQPALATAPVQTHGELARHVPPRPCRNRLRFQQKRLVHRPR